MNQTLLESWQDSWPTIKSSKPILFPELGPEAVFEMIVEKMPLIVGSAN
jgi:tartrate dehydratase beta subunit/fumarate hydratase class I family protein